MRTIVSDPYNLRRFVDAQRATFAEAIAELQQGRKEGHWIWFIFPQLAGLGQSEMSHFFGIRSLAEARAYLDHPLLGGRLRESVALVLRSAGVRTAEEIFGALDALKLRSCLTLFDRAEPAQLFARALEQLFDGRADDRTLVLLNAQA